MDAITELVSEEIDDDLSVKGERDLLNALTKTTIMMIMIRISLTILAMQFFCLLQNMLLSLCVYGTKISKYTNISLSTGCCEYPAILSSFVR